MADVIILGSAAGDASPQRANSSFLLNAGGRYYQFDAGEGCSVAMKRLKIDHTKIAAVFVSHMHADHISGIFMEIQMMFLAGGRKEPLPIYLPAEAVEPVVQFLRATYLFEEKMGFDIPVKPIMPDPFFRDDHVTIYARANSHLENYRKYTEGGKYHNQLQSYSFVVKTDNKKIVYSGDLGSSEDYADLLDGCDLLITEGLHVDLEKLLEHVGAQGVKQLVLTHLTDKMYARPEQFVDLARKYGISNVHLAADGLKLKI
jgi:ribonuclease BN (tRNA processing enzyme)